MSETKRGWRQSQTVEGQPASEAAGDPPSDEAELRRRLAELQTIYDTAPVGLCFLDTNLRYVSINDRLAAWNARPAAGHIGRTLQEVSPGLAALLAPLHQQVLETGEPVINHEFRAAFPADPDTLRDWLVNYYPVKDANGTLLGINTVVQDTTKSKQAEENQQREHELLQKLFDRIPVMVAMYRPDTKVLQLNKEFERLTGWTTEEARQVDLMEKCYPDPEYRETVRAYMNSLQEGWQDLEMTARDGSLIESSWTNIRLSDDTHIGLGIDIRERNRTKQALKARIRELEIIHNLNLGVAGAHSLEDIYERALDAVLEAVQVNRASLLLFDDEQIMRFRAWRGLSETYRRAVDGHSPWSPDQTDPPPILVADTATDEAMQPYRHIFLAEGIRALAFIPLTQEGRLIGKFMVYFDQPHQFLPEELRLIRTIGNHVVFAIARKQAEQTLRESEERLRFTLEAVHVGTWDWDMRTNKVHWSDNLEAIHNREPGTFDGTFDGVLADVHPEDRELLRQAIQQAVESGGSYQVEYRLPHNNNDRERWVEGKGRVIYEQDAPVRMSGICTDITERKQAEQALRESEQRLRTLLETLPVGVWLVDTALNVTLGNPAGQRIWGGTGLAKLDRFEEHKAWRPETGQPVKPEDWASRRAIDSGQPVLNEVLEIECFDGSRKTILNSAVPLHDPEGRIIGAVVVNEDITERRKAEQALRENEQQLRALLDTLPVGVWLIDAAGNIVMANPAGQRIWGGAQYVGPDQFDRYKAWWADTGRPVTAEEWAGARAIFKGETSLNEVLEIECFDSSRKTILNSAVPIRDAGDKILGAVIVNEDITDHRQAEKERERLLEELAGERAQLKELNKTLERKVEMRTEQVRSLAAALTLAEQRERSRISQVLHDDLQQLLYSQLLRMQMLNGELSLAQQKQLTEQVESLAQLLDKAIQVTRTLVIELNPPVLENEGLEEALQWLIRHMEETYGLTIQFTLEDRCRVRNKDTRTLLLQMVRELLFNVIKHAKTDQARVALWQQNGQVMIKIEDQGAGFDVAKVQDSRNEPRGFGLFSIGERLNLIGGQLKIDSSPGQGSRITITAPIN